jgi:hypothetical protein
MPAPMARQARTDDFALVSGSNGHAIDVKRNDQALFATDSQVEARLIWEMRDTGYAHRYRPVP